MKLTMFRLKNGDIINQIKTLFKINPNIKNKEDFRNRIELFFKRKIIEKQEELDTFDFINFINQNFEIENKTIISISKEQMEKYKEEIFLSFNPNTYNKFKDITDTKKIIYAKAYIGCELFNFLKNKLNLYSIKDILFLCGEELYTKPYIREGFRKIQKENFFFKTNKSYLNRNSNFVELKHKLIFNSLNKKDIIKSVNLDLIYEEAKQGILNYFTDIRYTLDREVNNLFLVYFKEKNSYLLLEKEFIEQKMKVSYNDFSIKNSLSYLNFKHNDLDTEVNLQDSFSFKNIFYINDLFYMNEDLNLEIIKTTESNFNGSKRFGISNRVMLDHFREHEKEVKYQGSLLNFCKENNLQIKESNKLEESYNNITEMEENSFYLYLKKDKPYCCFFSINREKERKDILNELDMFFENLKKEME